MAYTQTQWVAGDPITQEKMRKIEKGIADAHTAVSVIESNVDNVISNTSTLTERVNNVETLSIATQAVAEQALTATVNGTNAWTYVKPTMEWNEEGTVPTKSLASILAEMKDNINTISGLSSSAVSWIEAARDTGMPIYDEVTETTRNARSLAERIADMQRLIGVATTTANTAMSVLNPAVGRSIVDRLTSIDANQTPSRTLINLLAEVDEAHTSSQNDAIYNDIDDRFEADETTLNTHTSRISALEDSRVRFTDVINNLTSIDIDKPLSANKGKELKDTIGGSYSPSNTVASGIQTAQSNAEANAQNYTDVHKVDKTDIYNGIDYTLDDEKVLDARVGKTLADAIDSLSSSTDTTTDALDDRIEALETNVNGAKVENGPQTLDARFDAVEDRATQLETDVNTIAQELAMVDTDTIVSNNTRVDQLESDLRAMAAELDMLDGTAIVDTNTRVDSLESRITAVDGVSGSIAGLNTRMTSAEGAIGVIQTDLNTAETGLKDRMTSAESRLTATETVANNAASASDLTTLAGRVTTLENQPKSATVIIEEVTYDLDGIPTSITNPSTDVDYLLKNGNKYYYWKYIKTGSNPDVYEWALISGGGGGNTSGVNMSRNEYTALENKVENTDYYVTDTDGVHHYRWVKDGSNILTEIEIGRLIDTDKIKRYNIYTVPGTKQLENGGTEDVVYLNLYQYDYNEESTAIDTERAPFAQVELPKGGGGSTSTNVNRLVRLGDQTIQKIVGSTIKLQVFYSSHDSSGTESSAGNYTLKTGNTVIESGILPSGAFNETISGWKANTAGYKEFDVSEYCRIGSTNFTLTVEVNGVSLGKSWTVNIIDLHLESTAPDTLLISSTEDYSFPYTPFGALQKTLHVVIDDDTEHESTVSLIAATSGRQNSFTIPAQAHGAHKIEMYLTAEIGGQTQTTDSIYREYIWYDASDTENPIILASQYNNQTITAQQYSTIEIPYQVYKKGASSILVYYYLDGAVTPFDQVTLEDVNTGTLSYLATASGPHSLTIKVDDVSITVNLTITELNINVAPVNGAVIDFDPTTLTNSSANRLPTWTTASGTYSLTASDNFNWSDDISGGGYKEDADGKCFVIKAGSYVDLDYPMFQRSNGETVLDRGAEMKIIFKTAAVRDIEAVWFTNTGLLTEKTVGIQLGTHYGWLKTDKATDTTSSTAGTEYDKWVENTAYNVDDIAILKTTIYRCIKAHTSVAASLKDEDEDAWDDYLAENWLKVGQIDTEVIATNSYLYFPYSEEDKIELDININAYNANKDNNFIMSYEDGVPSKAYAYSYGVSGDGLYHSNTIRIGSPDCDVYLYHLRIYNKSLDTEDILQNFIADGKDIDEKVTRYNRNCIYWDATQEQYFTSPSATALLDPIKLAERIPNVKILMLDTPRFTTGKKDFVGNVEGATATSLRCLQADGGTVYPSRGDADNWFFQNGFHAGQGTTSDNYGQSARNVDFLFIADENQHYPAKKKNMGGYNPATDNYVSSVLVGKEASEWVEVDSNNHIYAWRAASGTTPDNCVDWKGDDCKVALTESSVPNNFFNLKVNVASSENVNNALFQKRYNDFLAYTSPAQAAQIAKHGAAYRAMGLDTSKTKVKNGMEFVPAILFVRENDPDISKHTEFSDCNWHFYALGNIGDSKKTDYTRAYDPDDMNEFTCENSDNNTNNGQFQSGVFMYQGRRAIETPYAAYDNEATYAEGDIVVNNGNIQIYNGSAWSNATLVGWTDSETPYFAPYTAPNPMQYVYPITSSEWNVKVGNDYINYKHHTLVEEEFDGDHSFEFRYACKGDYRDGDKVNDTNGKSSIVDPKDSTKFLSNDDVQFDLNHDVMLAFYEWLITATEEQYLAEAEQWFVPSAMEYFYAFTHYYTMMDNRAKNTFWHFAKTGVRHAVPIGRAFPALLHIYEESDGNGGYQPATGVFDNTKQYYTQYAFDLWIYDTDTALGIDNNGALVFPYGKEDTDYRTEGDPSSGYAFNGAGSIFWRRLRSSFATEIAEIMNNTDANCFNAEDLIQEFDRFQDCFPEEVWRLDIERKYIRTFTGDSIDNSIQTGKQNPRFLTSMMQGRKKYQRRQWIRNQSVYFNSKYRLTDIISNSNTIEFNCTTPADIDNVAVTPSYRLKLTPYQDMYLNVQVGNGNYKNSYITTGEPTLRAKAGNEYIFDLSGNYQETRIYINGANYLSGIGNLAPMYPYSFDLRALAHIKLLDIGTNVSDYVNTKFTELKLPNYAPLLETLNIKNCHSVGGTINLSQANNIRTIEAVGTSITGVSLPDYTSIETLHLPASVRAVSLYGARFLKDFQMINNIGQVDYNGLYTLNVYDSDYSANYKENASDPLPVDWINIALAMLRKESTETRLSLLRLSSATIGNIDTLETISDLKPIIEDADGQVELSGTINVTGNWSTIERDYYGGTPSSVWPNLEFNTENGTQQTKHQVIYRYDDYQDNNGEIVTGATIKILYINDGDTAPDIYANGTLDSMPSRASTVRESYEFGTIDGFTENYIPFSGWKLSGTNTSLYDAGGAPIIRNDTVIETYFNTSPRTYYVNWYMRRNTPSSLVKTSVAPVEYGEGYDLEAPTVAEIHEANQDTCTISISGGSATYSIFNGWEKLPTNITPTATDETYDIYASWNTGTVVIDDLFDENNLSNLTPEQLLVLSALDANGKSTYDISNKIVEGTRVTYTLGHDSIAEGTTLISGNPLRFDGSTDISYATSIQPLKAGNDAFTLAIDYCFNPNVTYGQQDTFATLVSCYYGPMSTEGIRNGFSLFYGIKGTITGPRVGFGDMYNNSNQSVLVGNENTLGMRNMVVLRHPAGSNTLYIYSGLNNNNTMPSNVVVNTLTWSNFNSNAYLNFGRLTSEATDVQDGTPQIVTNGKGTIFWAKYWNEDLGQGECKRLAAWPHEQMTYAISRLNSASTSMTRVSPTVTVSPSVYLSALSTSSHGKVVQSIIKNHETTSGRDDSIARTICNNRVFMGLPTQLQAIMCQPSIAYTVVNYFTDQQGISKYAFNQSGAPGKDYVFQYSAANLINDSSSIYATIEDIYSHPFTWFNSANVAPYTYSSSSSKWEVNSNDTAAATYLNIRFPFKAVTWGNVNKMRVFRELVSAVPNTTTIAYTIFNSTGLIKSGDIYIDTNNKTYVYVLNSEIQSLGIQIMPTTGDNAKFATNTLQAQYRGGWVLADGYWTRSAIAGSNGVNFAYSEQYGTPNTTTVNSAPSTGFSLMYTIAI